MENKEKKDRFGIIAAITGTVLYIIAIIFFVTPLEKKADTFFAVSWVFCPAIIGSLIYDKIERAGGWSSSRRL